MTEPADNETDQHNASLLNDVSPAAASLVKRIVAADGAVDLDAFMAVIADQGRLRIGALPWLEKPAARRLIGGLFSGVSTIGHRLRFVPFERDATLVYAADASFRRLDGRTVTLPYVNVLERAGDQVSSYDIQMDPSRLLAPPVGALALLSAGLSGWLGYRAGKAKR